MKIGVAIPCYIGHIELLFKLLDSIQNQTRLPDKVVVSCSSTKTTDFELDLYSEKIKNYTFFLQIITNEEKKNAAENRNIAAYNLLDMDYITFIDADDVMHMQRIELLLKVFQEHDSDVIMHNFFDFEYNNNISMNKIENNDITARFNSLNPSYYGGCLKHNDNNNNDDGIHHGHISIKRTIFDIVKFPEESQCYGMEDSIYCHKVFSIPNIKNSYIANKLTYYKSSATQVTYR